MSWVYDHQTGALAVFAGAAFAMCVGSLTHTAIWGFPMPKAAYLACTIVYAVAAPSYLFLWYHSRLYVQTTDPDRFFHRHRPWAPKPYLSSHVLRGMMPEPRPMVVAPALPITPPPRERSRWARSPAPAGYPPEPRPVEQVAAHPPAARFSTLAPPASRVPPPPPPPPPPRVPPVAIPRKPIGSAGLRVSVPSADPARPGGVQEHAVPPSAKLPPAEMRHGTSSLSRPAEPTKPAPGKAEDAAPAQASARPVLYGPRRL